MSRLAIVDFGLCNIDSIARACDRIGANVSICETPEQLAEPDKVIIPGVGAFPDAMANLRRTGLDAALSELVLSKGIPVLGICLGMHLIAEGSSEFGNEIGLGWIAASVNQLEPANNHERIPHVGWNEIQIRNPCPLLDGIDEATDFYFVHSYHLQPKDPGNIVAVTPFSGGFCSVVQSGNIFGTQFHPEKSSKAGRRLLENFLSI